MADEIPEVYGQMADMSDAELAFIARTVALKHPGIAEDALRSLADYKHDYPGSARTMFGAEVVSPQAHGTELERQEEIARLIRAGTPDLEMPEVPR